MTDSLFFFGTLRHEALLCTVLGHDRARLSPARLPDHGVRAVAGEAFPLIEAAPGAVAEGALCEGLTGDDLARLDFYEGGFGYRLRPVQVETPDGAVSAQVYFPEPGLWQGAEPWDFETWQAHWGAVTVAAAEEAMRGYGRRSPAETAQLLPFFRARAWAHHHAETAPQTRRSAAGATRPEITADLPGYDGFFRLRAFEMAHDRFDGSRAGPVRREVFVAYDAALVLPYDLARDAVLLVEQLRYAPLLRGDLALRVLEPVAGLIDAGESAEQAARREAVEEAGIEITDLRPMFRGYPSPGYSTEFHHCFLGFADLSAADGFAGGHPEEDEDIRTHVLPFDEAMGLIDTGEINAMPLAMMLLWLAARRPNLRAGS